MSDRRDPYLAFRSRNYQLYALGGLGAGFAGQFFGVALGWEVYERTKDAWQLGLIGLIQAGPSLVLALPAGDLADRLDRKWVLLVGQFLVALSLLALALASKATAPLWVLYALLLFEGVAAAFANPARSAILPQLVDAEALPNAITWNSSRWQVASTAGPALGGLLLGMFHHAWPVYGIAGLLMALAALTLLGLQPRSLERRDAAAHESPWQRLVAGARFVRSTPLILATATMDMLAVLFGGATALLPVFAKDILQVGPSGLGWLRAAPALGALAISLVLTHLPLRRAGVALLWAVAGFGAATIVFGLSKSFWLSLAALAATGALDNVSVLVRMTLLQALTPNEMQGRVSAINSVFITTSNEIGAFESGLVARFVGPIGSVVIGGVGCIAMVGLTMALWPQLRQLGALEDLRPEPSPASS